MTRLSAERFHMQQRIKEGQRAAQKYGVLVIPAACRHTVGVQLTGDGETNQARIAHAQATNCPTCGSSIVKRLPVTERED